MDKKADKRAEKERIEFRYYEMPQNLPLIALLGARWETTYGSDSMHFHNYMEIGYCYYGDGTMYLGKEERPYGKGTVTFIPRNFPHHTKSHHDTIEKWEYLFVDTDRFLNEIFAKRVVVLNHLLQRLHSRMFLVSGSEEPEIEMLVLMILNEMRVKKEFYQESVQSHLLALLLRIVRLNPEEEIAEVHVPDETRLEDILKVLSFIENHYNEEIKMEQLAQLAHMSETHFRRKFALYMNAAPNEYVNLVRMEKACAMLAKTDEKIETIAVKAGFQTTGSFIRNFKKVVGEVPRDWRKKAREKEDNPINYNVSILKGW